MTTEVPKPLKNNNDSVDGKANNDYGRQSKNDAARNRKHVQKFSTKGVNNARI